MIQVLQKEDTSGEAGPREFWIEDLIVDGQLLRFDSLEGTSDWELVPRRGSGKPAQLKYTSSSQPAVLSFRGKNYLMVLTAAPWPGLVRMERDGREVQVLDLQTLQGQDQLIVVEDPIAPTSPAVFIVALIGFAGVAWWIGPIRRGRTSVPWLILCLSVLHVLFWVSQCVGTMPDSLGYLAGYQWVLKGRPSYSPPGYPALLGVVGIFSGQNLGSWITLIQHAMAVVGGLWIYLLLRRLIPEELALPGGLLAGGLTPVVTMSQTVMTEIPTLFAMVGALYFAVRSAETGRVLFAILAGVLTGWAGTMRGVPLPALLPAIGIVYLLPSTKRGWRLAGLTVIVAGAVVLLPVSWFWYKSGEPKLTNSGGLHLFNRVVTEQQQLDERGPATRTLLALLEGDDPRGMTHWGIREHRGLSHLSYAQSELLLHDVSIEGIWKDPWGYLGYTPRLAWREFMADPTSWFSPWGGTASPNPRLERPPVLPLTAASLNWRWGMEESHRVIWRILCWAAIAGTIVGMWLPRRTLVLALAWVPTGYLLASASLDRFNPRHNVPIAPFVAALSMVALGLVFSAILYHRRKPPPRSASQP